MPLDSLTLDDSASLLSSMLDRAAATPTIPADNGHPTPTRKISSPVGCHQAKHGLLTRSNDSFDVVRCALCMTSDSAFLTVQNSGHLSPFHPTNPRGYWFLSSMSSKVM